MLVIFLPLYSAIVSGLMGRKVGERGAGVVGVGSIVGSFMVSCLIYYETVLNGCGVYVGMWR